MTIEDTVNELLSRDRRVFVPPPATVLTRAPGTTADADVTFALDTVDGLSRAIRARALAIGFAINNTVVNARQPIAQAVEEMVRWIDQREIVRVVGAGRALLAAAIPANRLAHCGARVHVLHDVVPLPNTLHGGNILAASASGRSEAVLHLLATARRRNPDIRIVGIADRGATTFADLCDVFVGIEQHPRMYTNPLQALADVGEYIISELLDAMVVAAARRLGLDDQAFREGHEDLGDTGPYSPEDGGAHA